MENDDFSLNRSKRAKSDNKSMIENYLTKFETQEQNTNLDKLSINFETKNNTNKAQDDQEDLPPEALFNPYLQSTVRVDPNKGNPIFTSVAINQVQADKNVQNLTTPDLSEFTDFDDKNSEKIKAIKILNLEHKIGLEDTK